MSRRDTDDQLDQLAARDDLPEDPTEIEVMIEGGESGTTASDSTDPEAQLEAEAKAELGEEADDSTSTESASKKADAEGADTDSTSGKAEGEGADSQSAEQDPNQPQGEAVVKTRDGKHEIPYSVLEGERSRARDLERQLEEANQRLQQASDKARQTEGNAGKSGEDDPAPASVEEAKSDDFDWQAFEDEYGEQATKLLKQQVARTQELEQQVNSLQRERTQEQQAQEAQTVQGIIDRIPSLAHWQANDDAMWAAAQTIDDKLAEDPNWANASMEDRFKEVTRRLGGTVESTAASADTSQSDQGSSQSRARAEQSRQGASDDDNPNQPGPLSHADIPGGGTPSSPKSTTEEIDESDPLQLEEKLERMSPEERDAYLARL